MRSVWRILNDHRGLWPWGAPLLLLAVTTPLLAISQPLVERRLIDDVVLAHRLDLLPSTAALYAALWLLNIVSILAGTTLSTYVTERAMLHLRERLFMHCEALSLDFSRRTESGKTLSLFVNDVPAAVSLLASTLMRLTSSAVAIVAGLIVIVRLDPELALVAGVAPPLVAVAAAVATRPLRPAARRAQAKAAELTARLQESLAGIREIVAFGRERTAASRFSAVAQELLRCRMRVAYIDTALQSGASVLAQVVTLALLVFGAYLVIEGRTSLGTVLAMRSLFGMLFVPAGQIVNVFSGIQRSLAAADRVYQVLDERPQVAERPGAAAPRDVQGAVVFEVVSFAYRPGDPVLENVSFAARPGDLVALVGPSGAGKTTLVSLIARFYDPTAGRVLLDGVDLRDLSLAGLRRQIAMVFQDTYLFNMTIRENIAFGRDGASEADIVAAARDAQAWEFIERLPDGLDTVVGERGVWLSEGQKQRIAIARAFLRDPRILILDEPTSALDARSEHLLQAALEHLTRGRTTFVIAHRLATVQRADRILVLDRGRIVEQGTHAELLARDGLYRELFALQFAAGAQAPSRTGVPRAVALAPTGEQ